jgi:hypothetical protein
VEEQRGDLLPPEGLTSRWAAAAALLAAGALAAWIGSRMWAVANAQPGVPMWDEAAHGLAGVEVAEALRRLDLFGLLRAIQAQSLWPFVHSLMLAPAFLIGGIGVAPAVLTSVILYGATTLLLVLAGLRLDRERGVWIGLAVAALALAAPAWRVYGTLVFLEMPGAFLLALAFLLHARSSEEPANRRRLAWAAWAATALVLCKYNYGALWLLAVLWWEWEGASELDRARVLSLLRPWSALRRWLSPMPLVLLAGVGAIVWIVATGGGSFTLFGQRVSARSPGNLPYALWLLVLLWLLVPRRGRPSRAGAIWAALPLRGRGLALGTLLPLAIWFTLPGHLRDLVGFGLNRDSGLPIWTAGGFLFAPRALASEYSPVPWLGWLALGLALWPPARERRAARLAWLGFAVALAATLVHRYRDARFLFTVCPLLWLCAADRAAWLVSRALRPARSLWRDAAWLLAGVAFLAAGGWSAAHDSAWAARRAALRGRPDVIAVLDEVLEEVQSASVDAVLAERVPLPGGRIAIRNTPPRLAMIGYANELSPGLLAWHARIVRPDLPPAHLPKRVPEAADRVAWLDTHADRVIVALADSGSAEYEREIVDERALAARLEAGVEGWSERSNGRVGRFRITRFERVRSSP